MENSLKKAIAGYNLFREKYVHSDSDIMRQLSENGQNPDIMVVACCDSRVDPAVILQCDPGDLFVIRNIANIVPPYEKDDLHHGTSAALEYGVQFLHVKHLIILGHSNCGGIRALLCKTGDKSECNDGCKCSAENDFVKNWVSLIKTENHDCIAVDEFAKIALQESYENSLTFPWIKEKIETNQLRIHLWFFNIETCTINAYNFTNKTFEEL